MATITIDLGDTSNPTIDVPEADKIKFHNTTAGTIALTTPQGLNPQGTRDVASGATVTTSGFTISENPGALLTYSWDDTASPVAAPRTGTIRVT